MAYEPLTLPGIGHPRTYWRPRPTLPFYDQAIPNPPSKSLVKMGVMGIYLWIIMGFKWDMI
jgi:hypothetical protein